MSKLWYIHIVEYYTAMKKNGSWLHTTWVNLTDITEQKTADMMEELIFT